MKERIPLKFSSFAIPENRAYIRNIGIVAHIDHGKTTFSDSLLSAGGMISEDLMGSKRLFDSDEQEKERGITIKAANANIFYRPEGSEKEYCIGIIDTPGHIDFNSEVVRALRVIDGAFVVVCAQEQLMPQTETVLKQCLDQGVRPILFINKVDRLIRESQLDLDSSDPERDTVRRRFEEIIAKFNSKISSMTGIQDHPWKVSVKDGTVIFGSAFQRWGFSADYLRAKKISLKDIYDLVKAQKEKEVYAIAPLWKVALETICAVFPNPVQCWAQRLQHIWKSGLSNESMFQKLSDPSNEEFCCVFITKVLSDPHLGFIYLLRIMKGTLKRGMALRIIGRETLQKIERVQRIYIYRATERFEVDSASFGQVVAVTGFSEVHGGDTLCTILDIEPFEPLQIMEPVISYSVSPKKSSDLVKFMTTFATLSKLDSSFHFNKDEESGEYIISGVGELHLENKLYEVKNYYNLEINLGDPSILYFERPSQSSEPFLGKSPRRHNSFLVSVHQMPEELYSLLESKRIPAGIYKRSREETEEFIAAGLVREQARRVLMVNGTNILIDATKGAQYLDEVIESMLLAFNGLCKASLFSRERMCRTILIMHDLEIHQTKEHRGVAEIYPAFFRAYAKAMCSVGPEILEPYQRVFLTFPQEYRRNVMGLIEKKEGVLEGINMAESDWMEMVFISPVSLMFGFSKEIRDVCRGRVSWNLTHEGYREVPQSRKSELISSLRKRRGLDMKLPHETDFD